MALKKKPVTGMKDILPAEMEIRDYVLGKINAFIGFSPWMVFTGTCPLMIWRCVPITPNSSSSCCYQ